MKGKFLIVNANDLTEYMKDVEGNIKVMNTLEEANQTCWVNELEDALILQVVERYQEPEEEPYPPEIEAALERRGKIRGLIRDYEEYKLELEGTKEELKRYKGNRLWQDQIHLLDKLMSEVAQKIKELTPTQGMINRYPILKEIL